MPQLQSLSTPLDSAITPCEPVLEAQTARQGQRPAVPDPSSEAVSVERRSTPQRATRSVPVNQPSPAAADASTDGFRCGANRSLRSC